MSDLIYIYFTTDKVYSITFLKYHNLYSSDKRQLFYYIFFFHFYYTKVSCKKNIYLDVDFK